MDTIFAINACGFKVPRQDAYGVVATLIGVMGPSCGEFCANFVPNVRGTVGDIADVDRYCGNVMTDEIRVDLVISY